MLPWLDWEFLSKKRSLSEIMLERSVSFPSSGEKNFEVSDAARCLGEVKKFYSSSVVDTDEFDGLSMSFENWRFNLRKSNTEPLLRLVETKETNFA